jgi:hypothetical protein
MKKIIRYIGGAIAGFQEKWGGTQATNYALVKAMSDHPDFELQAKFRREFGSLWEIQEWLAGGNLSHVDDTSIIMEMYKANLPPPRVIGPITRSPVKDYKGWRAPYTPEWFYRARVIRLNYAEEPQNRSLVRLIRHGVDTELLQPVAGRRRKYILWAGNQRRYAKNFPLMQAIMRMTELPPGYEFKVLSDYRVRDYWEILNETALVVNTSRYESFCNAAFEAMAKGVPVLWRENLQGGVHERAGLRLAAYEREEYSLGILWALANRKFEEIGQDCRRYVEEHASLAVMRQDLAQVYREAACAAS